jgi:predicted enzyme related to lactoylglutathione lyase
VALTTVALAGCAGMEWKLEVVTVPVSDVDRAKEFYAEKLGFTVDVDHRDGDSASSS